MSSNSRWGATFSRILLLSFMTLTCVANVSAQVPTYDTLTPNTNADAVTAINKQENAATPADNSYVINGSDFMSGPSETDIAAHMALMIFGEPVKTIMDSRFSGISANAPTGGITLISHMATVTSSLALFFTSFLVLSGIAGGLIYTGRDGELLGKEWDHKLFPLRASWHTAFLVPWPGFGGLAGIQVFIIFLGLMGIGIAGTVFKSGVVFLASGGQAVLYQETEILYLAETIISASMCDAYGKQYVLKKSPDADFYPVTGLLATPKFRVTTSYSQATSAPVRDGFEIVVGGRQCGTVLIPYNESTEVTTASVVQKAMFNALVGQNASLDSTSAVTVLFDEIQAIVAPSPDAGFIYTLVDDVNSATLSDTDADLIERSRSKFTNSLINSISVGSIGDDLKDVNEGFIKEVSKYGFAFFFKFYYELNARQEITSDAVSTIVGGDSNAAWDLEICSNWFFSCGDQADIDLVTWKIDEAFLTMYRVSNVLYGRTAGGLARGNAFTGDILDDMVANAASTLTAIPRMMAGVTNPDPILEVKALGDALSRVAELIFIISSKVKSVVDGVDAAVPTGLWKFVPAAIKSYIGSLVMKLWVALMPLWGLAFVYSSIIPAIPIVFGFVAVFSFFIYWVIAVYQSPFWYAMGAMPKGDGLIGRAGSGYSMAVNLLLMPSFMIVGFFTGMALMKVFGWFVSIAFFEAMSSMYDSTGILNFSFMKLIGILVVFGSVYTIVIWKCFGLIFEVPNTLAQWMGTGNKTDFGEGEAKSATLASAGLTSQAITQSVGKIDKKEDKQEQRLSKEADGDGKVGAGGGGEDNKTGDFAAKMANKANAQAKNKR
jgi:conjugal transfer/type IV secretion protein DotA/TraY